MKLLITMAGRGSRFRNAGFDIPKHEILIGGKPMFDWAMESLRAFFDREFIFVTQQSYSDRDFLTPACERLGITSYQVVRLNEYTAGQAATAHAADHLIQDSDPVAIYNIDTYIADQQISPADIHGDGFIPVFQTTGERWSFVQKDKIGDVTKVSEKEKISDNATVGFYYFDQWSLFTEAYEESARSVENEYGEKYVAPMYNHLIQAGATVKTHQIESDAVHVLGTPEDVEQFHHDFDNKSSDSN